MHTSEDWDAVMSGAVLLDELIALGVTDLVLAPGSRSAPLALAAARADAAGRLRLHVRLDERTAGFLALGLAKATGRVVPIVTTSGTAPAHLLPALLEARHSGVPLLALTADRPAELVGTGANQTTDQVGLYGGVPLATARLRSGTGSAQAWRATVRRLLATATGAPLGRPGPVHLNVELTEPLVGAAPVCPPRTDYAAPAAGAPTGLHHLAAGPATVVLVGDADPATGAAAHALAVDAALPLFAEPSSNARRAPAIAAYRTLLGTGLGSAIGRVVVFGHPTLSRPVSRLLARPDVEVVVIAGPSGWFDPGHRTVRVVGAVSADPGDPDWAARWREADREVVRPPAGESRVDRHQLAAAVWAATAEGGVLLAGSSQSVRDLDLAPVLPSGPLAFANRGLAGIDGTVSTAAGLALALQRPVTALVGDLTFLHDLTGLVIGPAEPHPDLRIVVANDDGGAIFHTLEPGAPEFADVFERVFATPHGVDLGAVVPGLGHDHRRVAALADLRDVLAVPPQGIEVVEVPLARG